MVWLTLEKEKKGGRTPVSITSRTGSFAAKGRILA